MDPQPRKKQQAKEKKKSKGPNVYSGKHIRQTNHHQPSAPASVKKDSLTKCDFY